MNTVLLTAPVIQAIIADRLSCTHIAVEGDDGVHFDALIVSPEFEGKKSVARHQLVYTALGERMKTEIHALSMRTLTPAEYEAAG